MLPRFVEGKKVEIVFLFRINLASFVMSLLRAKGPGQVLVRLLSPPPPLLLLFLDWSNFQKDRCPRLYPWMHVETTVGRCMNLKFTCMTYQLLLFIWKQRCLMLLVQPGKLTVSGASRAISQVNCLETKRGLLEKVCPSKFLFTRSSSCIWVSARPSRVCIRGAVGTKRRKVELLL